MITQDRPSTTLDDFSIVPRQLRASHGDCSSTSRPSQIGPLPTSYSNAAVYRTNQHLLRLAITDEASPLPLRSTRNRPRTAVRRGAASCRALLRSCPVTAAAGIVAASRHGLASAADAATQARFGRPAGGRRRRGRRGCPDAGHAGSRPVRVFGPPCGRPSSSQADVRCPHVRCPHDWCGPGVRTDTPPVSVACVRAVRSAGCWNASVRWAASVGRSRFDVPPWGRERRGRLPGPNPRGRDGRGLALRARMRVEGRQRPGCARARCGARQPF